MTDRLQLLEDLVARLRAPDGCPWDREQGIADLRPYVLEEAHEVAAAIDGGDRRELAAELGDLLFQIVFLSAIAAEEGAFRLDQVISGIHQKMVERHPHVFGDARAASADEVRHQWEKRKVKSSQGSLLSGVPPSLPALVATFRMTEKAAGVGFDWSDPVSVLDKVDEEVRELRQALARSQAPASTEVQEEVGDLLFTVANLARKLGLDPDRALAGANDKFRRRFEKMETKLAAGQLVLGETPVEELERLWQEVKADTAGEG